MGGGNKGGGGHTPYEAPDSLKSAQKLRAIGLISLGPIKGTVNKWKTTYFDNTPIQNENGKDDNDTDSFNFKNTEIQFTLGTQDQLPLKGFEASEREVPVNAEVKQAHPLTKTVIDPDVSRLRLTLAVSALFSQNDQGDTHGTSVTFQVLINNLPRNTYTIEGKSSSRFYRSYIIENLPEVPFTVTVKRVTEDSKSQRLQNATSWASYTEIIDTKLSYPNMALVGIKTDSRYNPNFPNINFLLHGRLVKIPSNYDPVARTYAAGIWKGDFKEDWTNNPAWIFYDLVTNKQIGLGERLGDFGVDKFQLYQIAQYCDQLVPDGYGGQEPRMTANLWITDQRSAYEVLSDMASVFRAMVIWNGQQMTATQDRPTDPVCTYTQSNVIDGKFTRQYVAQKAIYTAVEVEYADKRNMYQKAIEYVADDDLIRRYGYNVKKITAFACTSRGQAHRYGKWILETSRLEQCTITFSVGREGMAHLPGDIIEVADNRYANTNLGGRVLSVNGKTVTLDRPIDFTADSYLGYLSTVGAAEIVRVKILSVDDKQRVNLDREPVGLVENANWTLHTAQVKTQLYRAIGIAENEDGSFAITALQHEPQKEAIVDNGAVFEPRNTTILNTPKIDNIQIDVGAGSVNIQGDVSGGAGVVKYDIRIYKDGKLYDIQLGLNSPQIKLDNLPNGEYSVVIAVKNQDGQLLNEKLQTFTINRPPVPKNVRISGSLSDITLEWDWVDEVTQTEIFAAETDNIKSAVKIAKVLARTYSHTVGGRKVRYYWLRHVRGINNGAFYQETGLKGETGADIDKELELLNEKLSGKIVDTVIDTALPARNLELTKTVDGLDLNKFIGYNQVFNRADGKLYLWNGKQYTSNKSEVLAKDIQGIIGANQIAPIPTTQLQGTLSAQQIAANSIGTNHLQANVITADKLAANSVSAGALQAGAVRAEHVAAGQLTADKLAIGLGGNLLYNPIFANDAYGWRDFGAKSSNIPANIVINNHRRGLGTGDYTPKNALQTEMWQFMSLGGNNSAMKQLTNLNNWWVDPCRQVIRVTPGKQYIFSAYVACYNLGAFLYVEKWNDAGTQYLSGVATTGSGLFGQSNARKNNEAWTEAPTAHFKDGLGKDATRVWVKFTAPDNGVICLGYRVCRAADADYGDCYYARPQLEEVGQSQTTPNTWKNAGVTFIHGGSIVTKTITTQQLAANSVTANEIVAGAVNAKHVAARSLNATHIVTKSLTADLMNVSSLSAISANLGNITAGSININNRFKVNAQGVVEMRANAGNVGMVMTNEAIVVYDEKGVMRVKMGKLS